MRTIRCKLLAFLSLCFICVAVAAQQPQPNKDEPPPPPSVDNPDTSTAPRLVVKLGHSSMVSFCRFSPDGKRVLTVASPESVLILWDVATGAELRRFVGHTKEVSSIAFSPDGRTLLTSSWDKSVRLWDAASGKEIRRLQGPKADAQEAIFSPDGRYILTRSRPRYANGRNLNDDAVNLWDANTGQIVRTFTGHTGTVLTISFSRDGQSILTGSDDKTARLWQTATGRELMRFIGHDDAIIWAEFAPDGKSVWTQSQYAYNRESSKDTSVRQWDVATGKELRRVEKLGMPVEFSHDGRFLLVSNDDEKRTARMLDANTLQEIKRYERVTSARGFSNDDRLILAVSNYYAPVAWDAATETPVQIFSGVSSSVSSSVFSPDGEQILTAGKSAALWSTITGRETERFSSDSGYVQTAVFSPDGSKILTGGFNDFVRLWDVATPAEIRRLNKGDEVAFSPDGRFIATQGVDNGHVYIALWDAGTGTEIRRFIGGIMGQIAFSPDSRFLLTGGADKTARLWDVATGKDLRHFTGTPTWLGTGAAIAFSPNGRYLLAGSSLHSSYPDHAAQVWDVSTGRELHRLKGHTGWVHAVAISPDSKILLTGSYDGTARLWDAATGKLLRQLEGHNSAVMSVSFSPSGEYILTGGGDSTTRLWRTATGKELCRLISFNDGNWVVVDPDGRFDTNNLDAIKGLNWILPDDPFTALPIEVFTREYYEPRLLARIVSGENFRPIKSVSELNRVQPGVSIKEILWDGGHDKVSVSVEVNAASGDFQQAGRKVTLQTGAYDLRLFRDGQQVGYAPEGGGEIKVDPLTKKALVTFSGVKLPRQKDLKQIEFSAYAFNVDRVKSATARRAIVYPNDLAPAKGRIYLITVGVNAYENTDWNLKYAANDARQIQRTLSEKLSQRADYSELVPVSLISDYQFKDGQVIATEKTATKANIKAVLDLLAGKAVDPEVVKSIPNADKIREATPDDFVIISFSSHGYADTQGNFYFIPYDVGPGPKREINAELLSHCISSDELSLWLRGVDAGEMVMLVDACHSAAAVQGEGFKPGPMGSRGLGQLSYDKGMRILTSTQSDDVALETDFTQQGLLSYALTHDGIANGDADFKPRDKQIMLAEWLEYGVERVPKLYSEIEQKSGALKALNNVGLGGQTKLVVFSRDGANSSLKKNGNQQPALFDFTRKKREIVLVTK
jgi:WD40 repeat protein